MKELSGQNTIVQILNELTDTKVTSVRIGHYKVYYLWVEPDHWTFWIRFKERYPDWYEKAVELGARCKRNPFDAPCCPEFPSAESLFRWLERVTGFPFRALWVFVD